MATGEMADGRQTARPPVRPAEPIEPVRTRPSGGVQSVRRTFELLEILADAGGVLGLSQLSSRSGLPLPTIHRLMRTLVELGYVRQEPSREYALGPRLVHLGENANGLLNRWATPHLEAVVDKLGESTNLALFEGDQVTYVAQAPGRHSMRMFTEVGGRAWAHSSAVGKAMMARMPRPRVEALIERTGMPGQTEHTITERFTLMTELDRIRDLGYATDEEEQEVGVRCVAVALPGTPPRAAVSISGPVTRMTDELIMAAVPVLHAAAAELAAELDLARGARSGRC